MNARIFALIPLVAGTLLPPDVARAESFDAQQKALDLITSTADKICSVVSTRGEANSEEVKGNVNAQLRGLASKLADMGVSGTGSITSEQYHNVVRSDLSATLKDNAACKLKVFDTLQSKLLGPVLPSRPDLPPPPVIPSITSMSGTWHDTNDPNNVTRITQRGDRFEFTRMGTLQNGLQYESWGSGRMNGDTFTSEYDARYQHGVRSKGNCSGTLPRDGISTMNCKDTFLGNFSVSAIRE